MKLKEIQVPIVIAICMIGQSVVFGMSEVKGDLFFQSPPFFLFIFYLLSRGTNTESKYDTPNNWSIFVVLLTLITTVFWLM